MVLPENPRLREYVSGQEPTQRQLARGADAQASGPARSGQADLADVVPLASASGENTLGPERSGSAGPRAGPADDGVDLAEPAGPNRAQHERVLGAQRAATLGLVRR